jgi:rhodanese-related sulfurtransferase
MTTSISRDELRDMIDRDAVVVVDALPAAPYANRHLPAARNLTAEDPDDTVTAALPDRAAAIAVYSTDSACDRGPAFAARLESLGYTDVSVYAAGISDWVAAGLPVDSGRP